VRKVREASRIPANGGRGVPGWSEGLQRTLWDLAEAVCEEVEEVCADEEMALWISTEILVRLIQRHVRNMEVVGTAAKFAPVESVHPGE